MRLGSPAHRKRRSGTSKKASTSSCGAGKHAHFTDDHYRGVGAKVVSGAEADAAWGGADIVLRVFPITPGEASKIKEGGILIGFMSQHKNLDSVRILRDPTSFLQLGQGHRRRTP